MCVGGWEGAAGADRCFLFQDLNNKQVEVLDVFASFTVRGMESHLVFATV